MFSESTYCAFLFRIINLNHIPKIYPSILGLCLLSALALPSMADEHVDEANKCKTISISLGAPEFAKLGTNFPYQKYFKEEETLTWKLSIPYEVPAEVPLGILVYVNSNPSGNIPEQWKPLLKDNKLIWVSAENAGNDTKAQRRVIQALFAVQLAMHTHKIDSQRIYISGFSGGGRVASMMAPLYPNTFSGGIFMGAANEFNYKKGELGSLHKKHFAFIYGEKDFNLAEGKRVFKNLKRSNIELIEFFEVPNLDHHIPPADWLSKAIEFLDTNATEVNNNEVNNK